MAVLWWSFNDPTIVDGLAFFVVVRRYGLGDKFLDCRLDALSRRAVDVIGQVSPR